jgi:membrane protein
MGKTAVASRPKNLLIFIKSILTSFFEHNATRSAAELAYSLTMSLFPLLICLTSMLSALDLSTAQILKIGEGILPAAVLKLFTEYNDYVTAKSNPAMLTAALSLLVMSASACWRSVITILGEIRGTGKLKYGFVKSFLFAAIFTIAIYLAGIIILAGGLLSNLLTAPLRQGLQFAVMFAVLFGLLVTVYKLAGSKKALPGAGFAALVLALTGPVFSFTVEVSAKYSLVYGSLFSVVMLLLWFFICGNILIIGGIINSEQLTNNSEQ